MSHEDKKGKITSRISLGISILAAVVAIWQGCSSKDQADSAREQADSAREQTNLAREEKVTAQEAAKQANKALCLTLETGLNVADLTRVTFFGGFTTSIPIDQKPEVEAKLKAQEMFLKHLSADNNCPPKAGE